MTITRKHTKLETHQTIFADRRNWRMKSPGVSSASHIYCRHDIVSHLNLIFLFVLFFKGDCDTSFGARFTFSVFSEELIVGEIFVRIYNEQPLFPLEVRSTSQTVSTQPFNSQYPVSKSLH